MQQYPLYLKKVVFEEIHGSLCAKHVVQDCHQPTTTWTKNGPKMDPKWTKKWTQYGPKNGPNMDPKWTKNGPQNDKMEF